MNPSLRLLYAIFSFLVFFSNSVRSESPVKINEIVSSNTDSYHDENYNSPDWIELYNDSENPVNLKGWRISDVNDFSKAWELPDTIIQPKAFILIHASDENRDSVGYTTIEAFGVGIVPYRADDGFRFHYIKISGDFDMYMRIPSWRDSELFGKVGIIMRESLDPVSKYAGFFSLTQERNSYSFLFRSVEFTHPKNQYSYVQLEYPDTWVRLVRKGDSVLSYNWINGYEWRFAYGEYYPAPEEMLVGIALSSVNEDKSARASIDNLTLNGQPFDLGNFTAVDVACKHAGRAFKARELHTNFKLGSEGETIYLWKPDKTIADNISFPSLQTDFSYGRFPEGSKDFRFFYPSTPEKCNVNPYFAILSKPELSIKTQILTHPINVTIQQNEPDTDIRYTLNGSEPTDTSNKYDGKQIPVNKSTVLRVKSFKKGYLPSKTATASYIFNEAPGTAIISLSIDSVTLNDSNKGIFVDKNLFSRREFPVHFDFFDENLNFEFGSDAGLRLHGSGSRISIPQKSLRLYSRNIYENENFEYKFFNENEYKTYSKFLLRNAGQDWAYAFLRDVLLCSFSRNLTDLAPGAYRPAITYFNGEFFGLYNMRERIDEHYLSTKYNIPADSINLIENEGRALNGGSKDYWDMYDFVMAIDSSDNDFYNKIDSVIAIDNVIDYISMRIWSNIQDWPDYNQKYWKSNAYDGKWRWIVYDSDVSLGLHVPFDLNRFDFTNDPKTKFGALFVKFEKCLQFRNRFINRAADLLNTHFQPDDLIHITDSLAKNIEDVMPRQNAKWNTSFEEWKSQVDTVKQFISERYLHFRKHLRWHYSLPGYSILYLDMMPSGAGTIKLNSIEINQKTDSLVYYQTVPVTLKAVPASGYVFWRWSDITLPIEPEITLSLGESTTITAYFRSAEPQDVNVVINEIMYKPADFAQCGDWIELYNNTDFDVDISAWKLSDDNNEHFFIFPNNTIIKARDYLVAVENIEKFKLIYPEVTNYVGEFDFGYGTTDDVRIYDIDGKLIDSVSYTSVLPWPKDADGTGNSIELIHMDYDNTLPENWQSTYDAFGTPGEKNSIYSSLPNPELSSNIMVLTPNPIVKNGKISLLLADSGNASLKIYDILGKERLSLISDKYMFTGFYEINFDNNLPAGAYYACLTIGNQMITKIMLVEK